MQVRGPLYYPPGEGLPGRCLGPRQKHENTSLAPVSFSSSYRALPRALAMNPPQKNFFPTAFEGGTFGDAGGSPVS